MENKRGLHPQKYKINLKHLPPIDPSLVPPPSQFVNFQVKYEQSSSRAAPKVAKPRTRKERVKVAQFDEGSRKGDSLDKYSCVAQNCKARDASFCSTKYVDPNSTNNSMRKSGRNGGDKICQADDNSKIQGALTTVSAKTRLHQICEANNWKSPLFECCKEEGPDHLKLFTFKVTFVMVMDSSNTIVECFSAPLPKKKRAAEHAAEGALWYLKFLGYFPIQK